MDGFFCTVSVSKSNKPSHFFKFFVETDLVTNVEFNLAFITHAEYPTSNRL
jgi:hypothetical protein